MARTSKTPSQRLDSLYAKIGAKVLKHRTEQRISQLALAKAALLERSSVVLLEKGKQRIPIDKLYRIANALGCEIQQLLPSVKDTVPAMAVPAETPLKVDKQSKKNFPGRTIEKVLKEINPHS